MPLNPDIYGTVSAFRGTPAGEPRGRARGTMGEPARAGSISDSILKKILKLNPEKLDALERDWDYYIPRKFRGKCHPKKLRNGILQVDAANSTIRQELAFCEREILSKIKSKFSEIKKIRFV